MNILVNGGNYSRGPGSWPYFLEKPLGANIVNLGQSGAGNTYIHETTISELSQRDYDFVLIQWAMFNRFDLKVRNIDEFGGTVYTSYYQLQQNDWAEKIIMPINDQDYVEDDWVFGCGVAQHFDNDPVLNETFGPFYNHAGKKQMMYHFLIKIISLQSFLKANNIRYMFLFDTPFSVTEKYSHFNKQIDWYNTSKYHITDFIKQRNLYSPDGFTPMPEVYQEFAELILPQIKSLL